jgi:hypothetical protein
MYQEWTSPQNISLRVKNRPESASDAHAVFTSGLWNHEGAK